ncbi:hypothetical protein [Dysgonomonas macrotermitis]|uniref:Uncharacterized protein n=1 Tax=Dysgonomonas macrotermitis TaxID=1346286 RepID=A0A1M4WV06_9BACT|nr:hypothetical protein [Dysgonomonas macrotermitis]SHE84997.1 hypothetical protein SAMN05444362_102323 [Dysgonomonas macrotermitis]
MKQIILILLTTLSLTPCINAQNYNNIINYHLNNTPTKGIKIKTNIPFQDGLGMPSVKIEGYDYQKKQTLNLHIVWYVYNGAFWNPTISTAGGSIPSVWMSNENGKIVIFLDEKVYYQRFTVSVYAKGQNEQDAYFSGWEVVDELPTGANKTQCIYKNNFAGNVGIGTESPKQALDVNGNIQANILYLNNLMPEGTPFQSYLYYGGHYMTVGTPKGLYKHNYFELKPGGASNGTLFTTFTMYTSPNENQQDKKVLIHSQGKSFFNGGYVGIGTENPLATLDVAGTIRAQEVKIEIVNGADHVFSEEYNLKPLSEIEAFIKENELLPEIPSEKQMQKDGLNINEFQIKLLQKIEELTLYSIQQAKQIEEQKEENIDLKKRVEQLEKILK